jgi:hypothetical protein
MLAVVGIVGGMMLGELAVGNRTNRLADEPPSYSSLSANPDALVPQGKAAPPCPDCADSYGVAVRLRAQRDERMSSEFRELGAVDVDPPLPADPSDDYRFGGRFPDPEPVNQRAGQQIEKTPAIALAGDVAPTDEPRSPPNEY